MSKKKKIAESAERGGYLKPPGQELVLDFQEVAPVHLSFERLVEDGELDVVLDVLPASVAVSEGRRRQGQPRFKP